MKRTIGVFATLAIFACVQAEYRRMFWECELELGLRGKIVDEATSKYYFPCIIACVHEKTGVMVDSKIIPEKFISDYVPPTYSDYGELYQPKLIECINEANDQDEKCNVARSLNKCMFVNWKTIFPNYIMPNKGEYLRD